jgi:hypothetical protein
MSCTYTRPVKQINGIFRYNKQNYFNPFFTRLIVNIRGIIVDAQTHSIDFTYTVADALGVDKTTIIVPNRTGVCASRIPVSWDFENSNRGGIPTFAECPSFEVVPSTCTACIDYIVGKDCTNYSCLVEQKKVILRS